MHTPSQQELLEIQRPPFSPDVTIEPITVLHGSAYVVRDDLLNGGTKQRAAVPFVTELAAKGIEKFVYASPFCGFAQVALASACQIVGVKCILFCERDPTFTNQLFLAHEFTQLAESYGAEVVLTENLAAANKASEDYASCHIRTSLIPLGFNCEDFRRHLKFEIHKQWSHVLNYTSTQPNMLWLPVGSGTLVTVFRDVIKPAISIRALNVRVLDEQDPRILTISQLHGVQMTSSSLKFHERAQIIPPIASNSHYDAKIWKIFQLEAKANDIWWNVAR